MNIVLAFLELAGYLVAAVLAVLGWLVNRPTDSTRLAYRLATHLAVWFSLSCAWLGADGFWRWSALACSALWFAWAQNEWKRLEACRAVERAMRGERPTHLRGES